MALHPADYHAAFAAELARLNPAQRQAVDHTEGPVLVIAGPGTGKTHILAARIGHILLTTDTPAQSILCLTYTDAGVRAMRKRLLQLIGPEAHRVHIFTFHSFCNTVIQDNLAYFGRQGLEPLNDLEQLELTRQLLDELDVEHPFRRGKANAYFYEKHLRDLFQLMKTEDWTADILLRAIGDYLDDLPNRPEYRYRRKQGPYQAGDLKEALYETERQRMELLAAGVRLFGRYEAALARLKRYDYADMIQWVLAAFKANEMLLRNYQEQYLYFLVDEYQDTNGAQNELLQLLADYWDAPNLFIVGDDDQSIFEFQGARLKNLVDYYDKYRDQVAVVLLQDNYRSTQAILDAADALIGYNHERITRKLAELGVEKSLSAALPERRASAVVPVFREYANKFQEEVDIVRTLQARHADGVDWRDMAVIYAKHQQVQPLQQMMDKLGIPYQTKRKTNLLDTLPIRQLREMLLYLADERQRAFSGEHRLFRILHFRCFGLSPLVLAQLAAAQALLPHADRLPWRAWMMQPAHWPAHLPGADAVAAVGRWWETAHALVDNAGLPALVEHLLNGSGLLAQALHAPDRLWQVQLVKTFLDFVQEETQKCPRLTLDQLLRTLDQLDGNRLPLPLRKDIELEDGVHLLTAHSSKGLEFHTVFMLDASREAWEGGRSANNHFHLPDTLTLTDASAADETQRRLFYVAITRAEVELFVSYARQNHNGKEQQPSRFVDEIITTMGWAMQPVAMSPDVLLPYEAALLQSTERPQLAAMERSAVAQLLEGFQLSVSAWNRYLACPLAFFYEVVLQVPQIQRAAASYGDAMHRSLQRYFNAMLAHAERQFPAAVVLQGFFVEEMEQARPWFPPEVFAQRLDQGQRNLLRFHAQFRDTWTTQCRTELNIRQVEIDGVPIKGVIDRVDIINDTTVRLIDYKTGSHNPDKVRAPRPSLPDGGNYWRQLLFYKILWEARSGEQRRVASAHISYLDINKSGDLTEEAIPLTPEGERHIRALLQSTYARIMAHDFYTGCGEPDCDWCRFVTENAPPPTHTHADVEGLDDF